MELGASRYDFPKSVPGQFEGEIRKPELQGALLKSMLFAATDSS